MKGGDLRSCTCTIRYLDVYVRVCVLRIIKISRVCRLAGPVWLVGLEWLAAGFVGLVELVGLEGLLQSINSDQVELDSSRRKMAF